MESNQVLVERRDGVTLVTLNRPHRLNALNDEMGKEIVEILQSENEDEDTRVIIFTGAGRAFSAGADLNTFKALYEEYRETGERPAFGSGEFAREFLNFTKPMIAAVNGVAVGWGMTMPLTCDIRLASTMAKFSAAFVRVGVTPEFGSSYLLPRLVGPGIAAEMVFTARMVDAEEALKIGLVNRLVEPDDLVEEALSLGRSIAAMPPRALARAKGLLRRGIETPLEQVVESEGLVFQERMGDVEHYDAVTGLLESLKSR